VVRGRISYRRNQTITRPLELGCEPHKEKGPAEAGPFSLDQVRLGNQEALVVAACRRHPKFLPLRPPNSSATVKPDFLASSSMAARISERSLTRFSSMAASTFASRARAASSQVVHFSLR
jgi:hypothetical protein